nr:hypothetical protein Iba_chr09cCG2610 [Ipomoea batatas]
MITCGLLLEFFLDGGDGKMRDPMAIVNLRDQLLRCIKDLSLESIKTGNARTAKTFWVCDDSQAIHVVAERKFREVTSGSDNTKVEKRAEGALYRLAALNNLSRRNDSNGGLGVTIPDRPNPLQRRSKRNQSRFHNPRHQFPQLLRPQFRRRRRFQLVPLKENLPPPRPLAPVAQRTPRHGGGMAPPALLPAAPQLPRKRSPATLIVAVVAVFSLDLIQRLVAIGSPAKPQRGAFY